MLEVAYVDGKSRVCKALAYPPVRFVQPDVEGPGSLVYVSALGGGMLEGDCYRFRLNCGEGATMVFAPQANTRIFPCLQGMVTRQEIHGTVHAGALMVSGGDPTVLYRASRFEQDQHWVLHSGSRLVLLDWWVAGRLACGERDVYTSFRNDVRVEDPQGRPLLLDRLDLDPVLPGYAAGMGNFGTHLAVHVLGTGWEDLEKAMKAWLAGDEVSTATAWKSEGVLAGIGVREGTGFSLRALGRDRAALEPLVAYLFSRLQSPQWLGFNPWARKY